MTTDAADQLPQLPQPTAPENEPVINSPYRQPEWHWQLNGQTRAVSPALAGRRRAQNLPPVAGSRNVRQTEAEGLGIQWPELELVNRIRDRVAAWQEQGCPGITETTRRLIRHWTAGADADGQNYRFYFAQLDAVLTHIYLKEVAPADIVRELAAINDELNDGISRIAHKMATGTGKTLTMAMLILWQVANNRANPDDARFVRRFLLLAPGLTVRERLEAGLTPNSPQNDYTEFGILPPGEEWEQALNQAQVCIANEQQLDPQKIADPPGKNASDLLNGGANPPSRQQSPTTETPAEIAARITDCKSNPHGRVMVINDEAHHCHRGDPRRAPRNTRWFNGLTYLRDAGLLHYVVDMSATPIHMVRHGSPVEWIVSDYSLVDAIEAGLVKIPQVPTRTGRGQNPRFRDIYHETGRQHREEFVPGDQANNPLLKEALAALCEEHADLTRQWLEEHQARQSRQAGQAGRANPDDPAAPTTPADPADPASPGNDGAGSPEIPVLAIVMNNIANANAMFHYVAGGGANAPLLCNYTHAGGDQLLPEPRTIIVHSRMEEGKEASGKDAGSTNRYIRELAEVYRQNPKYRFSPQDKPHEIIRRVMNTVGQPGQPGEAVRCVISVEMLTEGWDAKTVTHLLGFRAFDSSLFCEQVAGRTLRRVARSYDHTGQRLTPEYARILGVPFPQYDPPSALECPRCGQELCRCEGLPTVDICKLERPDLRIEWPNIVRLRRAPGQNAIGLAPKPDGPALNHRVTAAAHDTTVLAGQVGPEVEIRVEDAVSREHFLFQAAGQATQNIIRELCDGGDRDPASPEQQHTIQASRLFGQALRILRQYARDGFLRGPGRRAPWPDDGPAIAAAADWLHLNIQIVKPPHRDAPVMDAVASARQPWLSTDALRAYRAVDDAGQIYRDTRKSPINHAHCDYGWEPQIARQLDEMPEIVRWTRNRNLNWAIPYVQDGEPRRYLPDFVAVAPLPNGRELHIVIEVKGYQRPDDPVKRRWAEKYWLPAVNRHSDYGAAVGKVWDYIYLDDLPLVTKARDVIAAAIARAGANAGAG